MKIKRIALSLLASGALALAAVAPAKAGGVGGNLNIGGTHTISAGQITGTGFVDAGSMSIASAYQEGTGISNQWANGSSNGTTAIGGNISRQGVDAFANTSQAVVANAGGAINGHAPIKDSTGSLLNGSQSFGKVGTDAQVDTKFGAFQIGQTFDLSGHVAFGAF